MTTQSLVLTPIEGEPRVHDLQLAERLEFSQALDIRKLIKRNEAKLLKFGVLATVAKTSNDQGGRPTTEFFLNKKQSIFICMKSETEKAFDVQEDIIHVYDAYLTGDFQLSPPNPAFRPEKTRKALPGGLTLEQQDAVKALVKSRVEALPQDVQAKGAITCWSAIKSKFGCTYKEVPAANFADVLSLVARVELPSEPKALPFNVHYPLESAAPPAGESGLGYYAFTLESWKDPNWELLLKLRDAGFNVDGPIYSHQAKIHVITAMYNALINKTVESLNSCCVRLPYAPVYLR